MIIGGYTFRLFKPAVSNCKHISAHKYFIGVNRPTLNIGVFTEENTTRTIFRAKNIHVYLFIFNISTLLETPPSCPNKKHKTYSQGWFNVGPAESESTLNQHWVNVTRGYTRRSGKCHSICIIFTFWPQRLPERHLCVENVIMSVQSNMSILYMYNKKCRPI